MRSRGQALVEALVASLLLVPFFLAVVQLALTQSTEQAALEAARTAAFAAHLGLDQAQGPLPPQRVRELFFPGPDRPSEVAVILASQASAAEQAESVAMTIIAPARLVGAGDLDFPRSRAFEGRAGSEVAPMSGPLDPSATGRRLSARLPMMSGDWDADGAAAVWQRTAALSSAGRIAAWRSVLSPVAAPLRLFEPAAERLCLGRIDPDIVPADRLRGVARATDLRTEPC